MDRPAATGSRIPFASPASRAREPFRWFFPLGALLGVVGILPWILFWTRAIQSWPGQLHATVMTQAFLIALVAGFLGTMIPRRLGGAPMHGLEAAPIFVGLVVIPVAGRVGAQIASLVVMATLAAFVLRRRGRARADAAPPSFVLLPVALGCGVAGPLVALLAPSSPVGPRLAQEGPLVGLVLAIAPLLTQPIASPSGEPTRTPRGFYPTIAAIFVASFPLELASARAGLLARAMACALVVGIGCGPWSARTRRGFHRGLFRLALVLLPVGFLLAAAIPARRVPFLHISFVGGLWLVAIAVSSHVAMTHTGRPSTRQWPIAVATVLALAALVVRVEADRMWWRYFELVAVAASLWLASALVWGTFVTALVVRNKPSPSGSP
jgi:uncharacterized protein involved in response to NO